MSLSHDTHAMRRRYEIAPVLEQYDNLSPHLHPYLIMNSPPDHRSTVVNTDSDGLRWSTFSGERVSARSWLRFSRKGLLLGSSLAFGVGVSSDSLTIATHLGDLTGMPFLNLGVRAGNSTQELIAAIPFLEEANEVVILSGANNLIAAAQSRGQNEIYGPFFFEDMHASLRTKPAHRLVSSAPQLKAQLPSLSGLAKKRAALPRSLLSRDSFLERADLAAGRQLRDARHIVRMLPNKANLLFCLQPFRLDPAVDTPEVELFSLHDEMQGEAWAAVLDGVRSAWQLYIEKLQVGLGRLGVGVLDANRLPFSGWAFMDRVHATDDGARVLAQAIAEELRER